MESSFRRGIAIRSARLSSGAAAQLAHQISSSWIPISGFTIRSTRKIHLTSPISQVHRPTTTMFDYDPHIHAHPDEHIRHVPLASLSKLSPYSALTLSVVLVILFLIKQFLIEAFLLKRLYGSRYTELNEVNRRGFVNHHIAGATKLIILVAAVYPFINVAFRYAVLNDPYARGSEVTLGDVLVVCTQILVGMYIFELIYRVKIRYVCRLSLQFVRHVDRIPSRKDLPPGTCISAASRESGRRMLILRIYSHISAMHHLGTIMVAQAAIAISLDLTREKDASIEFILCTVWGESGPTQMTNPCTEPRHFPLP